MRLILFISLALSSFCLGIQAADAGSSGELKQLSALEQKYLGHAFESESESMRLARLEKLVFGSVNTGSATNRIEKLVAVARDADEDDIASATGSGASGDGNTGSSGKNSSEMVASAGSGSANGTAGSAAPAADPYPRVGALEKDILGQTYAGQDLAKRLARMETKVYGSPSTSESLSDRTDSLQRYCETKLHKKVIAERGDNYGSESSSGGVDENGQPQKRSHLPGLINAVSTALFGLAGSPYYGALGQTGFSGVHVHQRQPGSADGDDEDDSAQVKTRPDDPAVRAAEPPPASATTVTKVGWCEVQLFGHTFTGMHLTERLEQINGELEYSPGTSGLELMDDVDAMIKRIVAKGPSKKAIGSRPQAPAR